MTLYLGPNQKEFLKHQSNILLTGGPGSGKTTMAILKAAALSNSFEYAGQKVLFLSFARPTIARVQESINRESHITKSERDSIEVDTYHSFFWRILRSHGYLSGLPRSLQILEGANEAEALIELREKYGGKPKPFKSPAEKKRFENYQKELQEIRWSLAREEGKVSFEIFAPSTKAILSGSSRVRTLVSAKYPYIILDEFQDTDGDQWDVVLELGKESKLIALADPEQQIYRWRGADPKRIDQYKIHFSPKTVDFSQENYRSPDTEITNFGNDLLTQKFSKNSTGYKGIEIIRYGRPNYCNETMAYKQLNLAVIKARKRLIENSGEGWSLAVLTGDKNTTKKLSELFSTPPKGCARITHRPIFDLEASVLAAGIISSSMEQASTVVGKIFFIRSIIFFLKGRNGERKPRVAYIKAAKKLENDASIFKNNQDKVPKGSVFWKMLKIYEEICALRFVGNPSSDWISVRSILKNSGDARLSDAGEAAVYLRLLERGFGLRNGLTRDWQEYGKYLNAYKLVGEAFMQEHFAMGNKPESGVVIMNIHKSKGKEFDEVIVFDGFNHFIGGKEVNSSYARIAFNNEANDETKQNLRVAVTRAKLKTTLLTPHQKPCCLLP